MKHLTACPLCRAPLAFTVEQAGQTTTCARCQDEVLLPERLTPQPGWLGRLLAGAVVALALGAGLLLLAAEVERSVVGFPRPSGGNWRDDGMRDKERLWPLDAARAPVKDWPRDKDRGAPRRASATPAPLPRAQALSKSQAREPLPLTPLTVPEPQVPNTALAGPSREQAGAKYQPLALPARDLCWSADGKSFYLAESVGRVRRVTRDGLTEAARLELGYPCVGLALSAVGLVVALAERDELWVLDPATLKVLRRIGLPGAPCALTAVPTIRLAFATLGAARQSLAWVDLATGQFWQHERAGFGTPLTFRDCKLSPGGSQVFAVHAGHLLRFRITLEGLVFEESVAVADSFGPICFAPDGRRVAVPAPTTARTQIYEPWKLQKPLFALETGAFPQALAFGPTGRIYGQNFETTLLVHDANGQRLAAYAFTPEGDAPRLLVAAPTGSAVLALTRTAVALIELPE